MNKSVEWREVWEQKSTKTVSDYEFDRGTSPREQEIEELSRAELLEFIDPLPGDIVFDAGCGTGANVFLLHSRVRKVIGMDCASGAVARCQRRVEHAGISNVMLLQGDVTRLPPSDNSVDKVLCMSVFQYLTDSEVRRVLKEFARVLRSGGMVVLHVKNLSSLYLSTLWLAKRLKMVFRRDTKLEHFRSFGWYVSELESAGFEIVAYNSFNIFMIESMPNSWLRYFQKLELRRRDRFPFCIDLMRRLGSELKIKARVGSS